MIRKGASCRISHPVRGTVDHATVDDLINVADLPPVPGAHFVEQVRQILTEGHVDCVAVISYQYGEQLVGFVALHRQDGTWIDLRDQVLTIEPNEREATLQ